MVRIDHFLIGVLGVGSFFYMFVSVTGGSYTMKLPPYLFVYKTRFCSYLGCCFHR